ncbi:MAG TPA: helix-turn-helix transcriptional regulator [Flavitalea sp.]|nr:helix-turn-helix transcriptional regulator [Flavitalea sp.]
MSHFGEYIKNLREHNRLLQREVSSRLSIDTPMLSKIERGERRAKREYIPLLAELFNVKSDELLAIWLADQVYEIIKDEEVGLKAIQLAEDEVKYGKKKK